MTNYPVTASGSIDMLGDEFPSPYYTPRPVRPSPLMADVPGADTSTWTDKPRPTITAWEGADMDAFYLADRDAWTWRHCQTGQEWKP